MISRMPVTGGKRWRHWIQQGKEGASSGSLGGLSLFSNSSGAGKNGSLTAPIQILCPWPHREAELISSRHCKPLTSFLALCRAAFRKSYLRDISKCLLEFPLLPFTFLLSYSKFLSVATLKEGNGRPGSIFRLNVIPLNLLQWPQ